MNRFTTLSRTALSRIAEFFVGESRRKKNNPAHRDRNRSEKKTGVQVMTKTNSGVAIYDTHSQAEEAVKNLPSSGRTITPKRMSRSRSAQYLQQGKINAQHGDSHRHADLRPFLAADSKATCSDDVGDIARDKHSATD